MIEMEEGLSGFCIKAGAGNNGGGTGTNGTKCGRWNPTTEQVKVLSDLFRSGLRTPSTDQIQKISNQLSFYGKIESKNVFYWFQNHKARERQKRRKLSLSFDDQNDFILLEDHNIISSSPKCKAVSLCFFFSIYSYYVNDFNLFFCFLYCFISDYATEKTNHHEDFNQQRERVIETLELFPLKSYGQKKEVLKEKRRFHTNEYYCKETTGDQNCYTLETEIDHPPLDLRLSFL